jgi:hypothetical protein
LLSVLQKLLRATPIKDVRSKAAMVVASGAPKSAPRVTHQSIDSDNVVSQCSLTPQANDWNKKSRIQVALRSKAAKVVVFGAPKCALRDTHQRCALKSGHGGCFRCAKMCSARKPSKH